MRRRGFLHLYGLNLVFDRVGQGPPVLLLAEEASRWPEVEGLDPPFTLYLLDLPGFGRTGGPIMTPEEVAQYVAAFVVMLNLGAPPVLLRGVGLALKEPLEALGLLALPAEGDLSEVLSNLLRRDNLESGGEV
ncbi:alpha/beta fold hydrolase [Thermus sp.]